MIGCGSHTIELVGVFAQLLGAWYPKDHVVAAIDHASGTGRRSRGAVTEVLRKRALIA